MLEAMNSDILRDYILVLAVHLCSVNAELEEDILRLLVHSFSFVIL